MRWDEGSCATDLPSLNFPHPGRIACCSTPNNRPPATKALHTICGNNTSIVSSSWRWAYECPKHVEQIIIAIKHSVTSSWFSSLRLYYDARTNIHQIWIWIDTVLVNFSQLRIFLSFSFKHCPVYSKQLCCVSAPFSTLTSHKTGFKLQKLWNIKILKL